MARIMISMSDLTEEKQWELMESIEEETGENFGDVEVSHEIYIQVDIDEEGVDFS